MQVALESYSTRTRIRRPWRAGEAGMAKSTNWSQARPFTMLVCHPQWLAQPKTGHRHTYHRYEDTL
jgi:hypothetical protein